MRGFLNIKQDQIQTRGEITGHLKTTSWNLVDVFQKSILHLRLAVREEREGRKGHVITMIATLRK